MQRKKIVHLFKNDFSGSFWFYYELLFSNSLSKISTLTFYINAKLLGVKLGQSIRIFKVPILKRKPLSRISIGDNCIFRSSSKSNLIGIDRKCIIATHTSEARIQIGNNCGFSGTVIGSFLEIIIENNVRCGANTLITDSDWHDDSRVGIAKPVIIEEGVWLGLNVVVLKGVTIGKNSVIGAGSVVVKDIPANVIAAGNPCKIVRRLDA